MSRAVLTLILQLVCLVVISAGLFVSWRGKRYLEKWAQSQQRMNKLFDERLKVLEEFEREMRR